MADAVHDAARLKELQALPLERKIQITQTRIIEWYQHYNGNVCISFSGGKDSTVLLHIARQLYPDIPAVFSNTGLEYPEIQRFVKSFDNIDIVTPSMRFDQVISTYGYPLIGKEVAEAIYYARRIRLQSVNVEREREASQHREVMHQRTALRGERLQNSYRSGGADRSSESGRDSQCQAAEESSHRDKHCKEQTNSPDRADERTRNGAGVVVNPMTIGGGWNHKSTGEESRCKGSGHHSVDQKNSESEEPG